MAAPWIVDDGLWELIEPLLPPWPTRSPGPRPVDDWRCLQPILFVLHTGIGGQDLPADLGFGSEMTCRRRLRRWTDVGIFDLLHQFRRLAVRWEHHLDLHEALVSLVCALICRPRLQNRRPRSC